MLSIFSEPYDFNLSSLTFSYLFFSTPRHRVTSVGRLTRQSGSSTSVEQAFCNSNFFRHFWLSTRASPFLTSHYFGTGGWRAYILFAASFCSRLTCLAQSFCYFFFITIWRPIWPMGPSISFFTRTFRSKLHASLTGGYKSLRAVLILLMSPRSISFLTDQSL